MRHIIVFAVLVCVLAVNPAFTASPIDCTKFVPIAGICEDGVTECDVRQPVCPGVEACIPKHTCIDLGQVAPPSSSDSGLSVDGGSVLITNGDFVYLREATFNEMACNEFEPRDMFLVRRYENGDEETLAQIIDCASVTGYILQSTDFNAETGEFLTVFYERQPTSESRQSSAIKFSGFPTRAEIQQTYTPSASAKMIDGVGTAGGTISFPVPASPEYLLGVDDFDLYYGTLSTVGDWSQTSGLQCGFPATAPTVGDYLTVSDTLPEPTPGDGYYYVTAVNYQGQRRYGRQSNGGVLTGRNPAVLPGCN